MYYMWLGDEADKVEWYTQNYSGIALKMHLAIVCKKPNFVNLLLK